MITAVTNLRETITICIGLQKAYNEVSKCGVMRVMFRILPVGVPVITVRAAMDFVPI